MILYTVSSDGKIEKWVEVKHVRVRDDYLYHENASLTISDYMVVTLMTDEGELLRNFHPFEQRKAMTSIKKWRADLDKEGKGTQ